MSARSYLPSMSTNSSMSCSLAKSSRGRPNVIGFSITAIKSSSRHNEHDVTPRSTQRSQSFALLFLVISVFFVAHPFVLCVADPGGRLDLLPNLHHVADDEHAWHAVGGGRTCHILQTPCPDPFVRSGGAAHKRGACSRCPSMRLQPPGNHPANCQPHHHDERNAVWLDGIEGRIERLARMPGNHQKP